MGSLVDKLMEMQHQEEPPRKGRDWGPLIEKVVLSLVIALVIAAIAMGLVYAASNNLITHHTGTVTGDYLQQSPNGTSGWTKDDLTFSSWTVGVGSSSTQTRWVKNITTSERTFTTPIITGDYPAGVIVVVKSGGVDLTGQTLASGAVKQVDIIVSADTPATEGDDIDFDVAISVI